MRSRAPGRWFIITLITVVALIGLVAGATTHLVLTVSAGARTQNTPPAATPIATVQTETPTPTSTTEPTVSPVTAHFSIKLTVAPASSPAGASITINAHVTDNATGAPIGGVTCQMRAPTKGGPGLLSTWPAPAVSDSSGIASWTVTIPQVTPGRYVVEVFARTRSWSYVQRASVIVTAFS